MTNHSPRGCLTLLAALGLGTLAATAAAADPPVPALQGAGASFPAPLYVAWAQQYRRRTGVVVRYEPVGSGAGIARIERAQTDFGASDAPLSASQLHEAHLLQFPMVIGAVVPVINIRGIRPGELRLTGALLADIYLGRVRRWNDQAIRALNPTLSLPSANITVVHREEASGTSLLWSGYLAASSQAWSAGIGAGTQPRWPTGVGARGNEGIATLVQRTRFALGYVEYYFARAHGLSDVTLRNHDGHYVRARPDNFSAALKALGSQGLNPDAQLPSDAPGADSWPITGASFILMPQTVPDPQRARQLLHFLDWALHDGAGLAEQLDYVPLPESSVAQLPQLWQGVHDAAGAPIWP